MALLLGGCKKQQTATEFVAFDSGHACVIAIPERASAGEQQAAQMIQDTLAKASGRAKEAFSIIGVGAGEWGKPVRSAGSTLYLSGSNHQRVGDPRLMEKVSWRATSDMLEISSYPADAIEGAAAWFLRETVGARWFIPGELGAHVPEIAELKIAPGERHYESSYFSRNMYLGDAAPATQAWWSRNRLHAWFQHGHAMTSLFKPEDLKRNPDFVPLVNGVRQIPAANDGNWQPNLLAPGAAEHAAEVLRGRHELSSAIGLNDSIRFDQSEATREAIGAPHWFRQKPDYAGLYFKFVNDVAQRIPSRYLGAYAYDWTENVPDFPIERNVVPYLTSDRSDWFDPTTAAEDQALIRRWAASGAEVVGLYDYYYGAPFLVPRPTLYAVTRSIPFAYQAGVRGFYAEVNPNWGLDGPKAWLAAELLWDATAKPEELLNIYYRDFWREAGDPMRKFFDFCDEQWLNQPKPSYWIKYYKDEHQYLLFPKPVREKLKAQLDAARFAARTELTQKRVAFTAEAFAVTDAFCAWEEAKDLLSRAALPAVPDNAAVHKAWGELEAREQEFRHTYARVRNAAPLAVRATILGEYERNDPRLRAAWRLRSTSFKSQVSGLDGSGRELLHDPALAEVRIKPPETSFDLEWAQAEAWRGHGEPYETRQLSLELGAGAGELVMKGCKQETFSQLVPAQAGQSYVARVKVHGKVSPGNMTFLILNFQDAEGRALGLGVVDRLPVGDYGDGVELVVWAQAPKEAKWVGLGVRALNQVGNDFAAFSGFSLQALTR